MSPSVHSLFARLTFAKPTSKSCRLPIFTEDSTASVRCSIENSTHEGPMSLQSVTRDDLNFLCCELERDSRLGNGYLTEYRESRNNSVFMGFRKEYSRQRSSHTLRGNPFSALLRIYGFRQSLKSRNSMQRRTRCS